MSEITLTFDPDPATENENLLIGGDYFPRFDSGGQLIAGDVNRFIENATATTVNLEAPIQSSASPATKYGPTLDIQAKFVDALASIGIDAVQLANNHIMDYGKQGLQHTIDRCESRGLEWMGAGSGHKEAFDPVVFNIGSDHVSVINAGDREFGTAYDDNPGYAWFGDSLLLETLRAANERSDIVILILHGGIEYEPIPAVQRQKQYRKFAEYGADAIIGHHPHVPKGWEVHNGTPICYSLGHFLFDFEPEYRKPKTEWGLLADIQIANGAVDGIRLIPIQQNRHQPRVQLITENSYRESYLFKTHNILADDSVFNPLWQELAVQRYNKYYNNRINRSYLSRLLNDDREYYRWLQNISQCEAHNWCIRTATEVLGETVHDKRSKKTAELLELLQQQTRENTIDQLRRRIAIPIQNRLTSINN